MVKASGSCNPRTSGNLRLGTTILENYAETKENLGDSKSPKGRMICGRISQKGEGKRYKGEERREVSSKVEEEEVYWVQEERIEKEDGLVEIIQEDPWMEEWMKFKVPRVYAEKEWKR